MSPERQANVFAESPHLWQVHCMAVESHRLYLVVINNPTKLTMHTNFEIPTFGAIVITIAIIAAADNVRVVSDHFYEVDISCWRESNHAINPWVLAMSSSAFNLWRVSTRAFAKVWTSVCEYVAPTVNA